MKQIVSVALCAFFLNVFTGYEVFARGNASILLVAKGQIGVREYRGRKSNPRISAYFRRAIGRTRSDNTPWCSAFIGYVVKRAGHRGTNSLAARSWLRWGRRTKSPRPGDLVIFRRGRAGGHVGIFVRFAGNRVRVIGGNQGDSVSYKSYSRRNIIGYRTSGSGYKKRSVRAKKLLMAKKKKAMRYRVAQAKRKRLKQAERAEARKLARKKKSRVKAIRLAAAKKKSRAKATKLAALKARKKTRRLALAQKKKQARATKLAALKARKKTKRLALAQKKKQARATKLAALKRQARRQELASVKARKKARRLALAQKKRQRSKKAVRVAALKKRRVQRKVVKAKPSPQPSYTPPQPTYTAPSSGWSIDGTRS